MARIMRVILLALLLSLTIKNDRVWSAIGIGTKFGAVVLEKLEPGGVYNLRKLKNLPLIVINSGDADTEAVVEIELPREVELKKGYEPIADPSWIRIIPNKFILKPGEKIRCDLVVAIPDDDKLIGKHYQAKIWSHTGGVDAFGAGVVNRIFFSVGVPGPEEVRKAKKKKLLLAFDFDVIPEAIYLSVPIGERINVLKEFDKTIALVNRGKGNIVVKLESVENEIRYPVLEGYKFTTDIDFLKFSPDKVKVKKRRVVSSKMFIEIPDDEKYRGEKYMFLVKTFPVKPEIPLEFHTRVYVTVK